ncbi:MAG: L,D-transpeptidase family protein [Desulfovibrionaceae bacterium]
MRWWGWIALGLVLCMVEVGTAMAARREAVRLQGLALLAEPRDGATMVRALRVGETVTVAGRNGNWVEVVLADGTHGYVQGGFLTGFSDIPPIAAYANRIDATVVRPAQTGEEKGLSVAAADKAVPVVPEKTTKRFEPRPLPGPYVPVADGGGLDGLLACLITPSKPDSGTAKMPPGDFNDRKNRYIIEVHLSERKLYLYENLPDGSRHLARTYVVAVPGRDMEAPHGWGVVTGISFEPTWIPTPAMKERAKKKGKTLPTMVKPGAKDNPMGPFKIILSHGYGFRIHGNNNPGSIGRSVTSGCIRMRNDEGKDMAKLIDVGTEVVFQE